jgi:alpha-mannosidase
LFPFVSRFFQRWWREQDSATRAEVQRLVASRQLEFISGGYVMHDEAVAHYVDMIDQMSMGHWFLRQTFDVFPQTSWQIGEWREEPCVGLEREI